MAKRRKVIVAHPQRFNVSALLIALPVFFYCVATLGPGGLVRNTQAMFGAVATVSASVPPNSDSITAQQLAAKAAVLDQEEKRLTNLENTIQAQSNAPAGNSMLVMYSFILSLVVLVLVSINFYLDVRRGGRGSTKIVDKNLSVDLRRG